MLVIFGSQIIFFQSSKIISHVFFSFVLYIIQPSSLHDGVLVLVLVRSLLTNTAIDALTLWVKGYFDCQGLKALSDTLTVCFLIR